MPPAPIRLAEYFDSGNVRLHLHATSKTEVIRELLGTFELPAAVETQVLRTILRREEMGSTGIGLGVAVPHGRTPLVSSLRVAYGRSAEGIPYGAADDQPVHHVFLLVAPPVEQSNTYLPVLGRIAQLVKEQDIPALLAGVTTIDGFKKVLEAGGNAG